MGWLSFFLSLTLLLLSIFLPKKIKSFQNINLFINPAIFFNILWTFILFLSALNLYNIDKPSDSAYWLLLLMQTCFTIGHFSILFIENRTSKQQNPEIKTKKASKEPIFCGWRLKLFYAICILTLLLNIIDIILVIYYLSEGIPAWQVHNWTLEPYGSSNPILDRRSFVETIVRNIILASFNLLIAPTSLYLLIKTKHKHRIPLFILSLIILITSSVAGGGGRLGFITYLGCAAIIFYINRKETFIQKIIKKYKKIFLAAIACSILALIVITIIRTGFGNSFKQLYTYFALPPTLLSKWLTTISSTPHTYGMLTFYGIIGYPLRALGMLGLPLPNIFTQATTSMLNAEKFLNVGYGVANAFVSPVYYFMIDGGIIFTIIASLFFGAITTLGIIRINKENNLKNTVLLSLIIYGLFISFVRVQTVIPTYIIAFIIAESPLYSQFKPIMHKSRSIHAHK